MIRTRDQWRGTARELAAAVARGEVLRVGRYYVSPDAPQEIRAALAEGLRPTCATAAEQHGLWVPPVAGVHVYSRRGSTHPGFVGHGWHHRWPEDSAVASPQLALRHAMGCLDPLDVGIIVDSALHQGLLGAQQVRDLAEGAPRGVARVLARACGQAQSGTESKARLFMQLHNVTVTPQVEIDGVGRVDNLAGRRWILECDSRAHHTGVTTYATDRARDLRALELGYFTTRLTHWMVFAGWRRTSDTLLRVIRSGRHLDPPERWAL